ncbi:hypothetical protein GCM10009793_16140 [Brachybacterium phenoliresistens]
MLATTEMTAMPPPDIQGIDGTERGAEARIGAERLELRQPALVPVPGVRARHAARPRLPTGSRNHGTNTGTQAVLGPVSPYWSRGSPDGGSAGSPGTVVMTSVR